jgi:hypothetical protein
MINKTNKNKKQHKHFWLPLAGYKNPNDGDDYSGHWGVTEVYCAYCLKTKEL